MYRIYIIYYFFKRYKDSTKKKD